MRHDTDEDQPARERTRETLRSDQWYALLFMTRVLGGTVAAGLLLAHRVTDHDLPLAVGTVVWMAATLMAFGRSARLRSSPLAWAVDTLVALLLVVWSEDWRSPFYLFALTTLVLPAATLPWRKALLWSAMFSAGYAGAALLTRQLPADTIENTIRLETLATHLVVPVMITLALAYASGLLDRLGRERERSERLAIQAERQRIAWELHDSAKQRVHAAHLMLSVLDGRVAEGDREVVGHVLAELRGATADMETSIEELRTPVDARPVDELLRERAVELQRTGHARVEVDGRLPALPPLVAAHTYRIAAEALTNAVRHAGASRIRVTLAERDGEACLRVVDDGTGLPEPERPGHGLRSMRGRAETIGARLHLGSGDDGRGTAVDVRIPLRDGAPAAERGS